jgi:hypothetical protein
LTSSTALAALMPRLTRAHVIEQNTIPENQPVPRIWYQRSSQEVERDAAGAAVLTRSTWDMEVISDDIDECLNIADAVKTRLDGHFGLFGSTSETVKGVFVRDHDDEYLVKGLGENEGAHVAALSVEIIS